MVPMTLRREVMPPRQAVVPCRPRASPQRTAILVITVAALMPAILDILERFL